MANFNLIEPNVGASTSFAGCNIVVLIEDAVVVNVQSITVNTTRETVPIYVMGSADPIGFVRNKRAVAGAMTMFQLDRSALMHTLKTKARNTYSDRIKQGIPVAAGNISQGYTNRDASADASLASALGEGFDIAEFYKLRSRAEEFAAMTQYQYSSNPASKGFRNIEITHEDQLPPFDINVNFMNEESVSAHFNIRGVRIMNTARGWSIDDATNEIAMTFVAQYIEDLRPGLHDEGSTYYKQMVTMPSLLNYYESTTETDPFTNVAATSQNSTFYLSYDANNNLVQLGHNAGHDNIAGMYAGN